MNEDISDFDINYSGEASLITGDSSRTLVSGEPDLTVLAGDPVDWTE